MKKFCYMLILSFISGFGHAAPELKGSPQELRGFLHPTDRIVTIRGEAEETAYSDKAIISLVITTEDKLLSQSIASNSVMREKITALLIQAGIKPELIKSSKFSSSPKYGWFGKKPSSYKVVNRMAIAITEEKHLKDIALVADNYKEAELSDTTFEYTKKDAFKQKVKEKALADIIKQKQFYEQSLGIKLIAIGIRDSDIRHHATRGAMVLEEIVVTGSKMKSHDLASEPVYQSQMQEPSFDEVQYEADLSVDFKIVQ